MVDPVYYVTHEESRFRRKRAQPPVNVSLFFNSSDLNPVAFAATLIHGMRSSRHAKRVELGFDNFDLRSVLRWPVDRQVDHAVTVKIAR